MGDFGLFESDEAAQDNPRLAARTAARKMEAAIDTVRNKFGRFLLGATGIDEFGDRWHYSKNDIRAAVEPYVFPNTGTMRRIQNAMKADWKLAHPYKLAEDRDAPIVDTDETFAPSGGNLIPEGNFQAYEDSVDQGGPAKVQRDFTPGGDSGSDRHARRMVAKICAYCREEEATGTSPDGKPECKHCHNSSYADDENKKEAARLVADIYTDFAQSNGLRVASLDTLDRYAATGIHDADYRLLQSMIVRAAAAEDEEESEEPDEDDEDDHEEPDADNEGGHSDGDEDDEDDDDEESESDDDGDEDYDFGGGDDDQGGEAAGDGAGGEQFTVPEQAPDLDPQMLNEIPHDDPQGAAPVPPEVIDSLLGLPEGTIEQLLLEEVEQGQGGSDGFGGAPEQGGQPDFGGGEQAGPPQGGGDDFFGGGGDDTDQEPPRVARRRQARQFWAAEDDESSGDSGGGDAGGGQQAGPPAQDPAAAGGAPMDPSAMGGQPMMPPPGSQAVQPPQPPMPLENQPAEDALLDTANQAIMQMIDQETAEYQQIIDPLSKALQAIQFAQQVEQSEHPMDVTPPQGTVDVSPSAAPGGAGNPMQQQARRRRTATPDRKGPWTDIVYAQGDDYNEMSGMGPEEMFHHMKQWDYGDDDNVRDEAPWGTNDRLHSFTDGDLEYVVSEGDGGAGLVRRPINRQSRRQAKINTALRNAAALIAHRYRLSATGHQMLLEAALGRRGYEHVVEALRLVPADFRRAAAIHMSHLFAAGNDRFNKDVFLKTVMASNPRDRAGDAWRDGRDRGIAEHGRHDMEDVGYLDLHPSPGKPRTLRDRLSEGADLDWVDGTDRKASRGRLPFDRTRRTAGETWTNTPTKDAFEFPHAGETPRVDDNIAVNDLPTMKGASSQKVVDQFARWTQRQQQMGLPTTEGDAAVHNFLQNRNGRPGKNRVGDEAAGILHRSQGLTPDAQAAPRVKVPKAVNPAIKGKGGKTPAALKSKTASFFTRRVPGWRWDDHLSGYISKEGRAFTCSCGEKIPAPSYRNCKCGKLWNLYAIGDTHHLASDSAEMFIAREIPVRDNVIMANRKMAGDHENKNDYLPHPAINYKEEHGVCRYCGSEITAHPDGLWRDPFHPDPEESHFCAQMSSSGPSDRLHEPEDEDYDGNLNGYGEPPDWSGFDPRVIGASRNHRELLAEIERLADWTKYDGPDPSRDPKAKPPSTTIKSQPADWTDRDFSGPTKGQWREPDPTELPRKTRKKK